MALFIIIGSVHMGIGWSSREYNDRYIEFNKWWMFIWIII